MTTALITGCASGFGERAALALGRRGVRVAAGVRDFGRAQGLVNAAAREKLPVELVKLDVRSDESVAAAVADVHEYRRGPASRAPIHAPPRYRRAFRSE